MKDTARSPGSQWATRYIERFDWQVFPVRRGTKIPLVGRDDKFGSGQPYGMTNDPEMLLRYFDKWPDCGLGLPTGKINKVFVVETDTKKGHPDLAQNGEETLEYLVATQGPLPDGLLRSRSPSGSIHRFFVDNGDGDIRTSVGKDRNGLGIGLDVRGDGGMVILPPSIHPKGGDYVWENWESGEPVQPPLWLLAMVTRPDRGGKPAAGEEAIDQAKVDYALGILDPDLPRDQWVAVGCSLYRMLGGEVGMAAWQRWSARGRKYDAGNFHRQWNSIVRGNYNFNATTLWFLASQVQPHWQESYMDSLLTDPDPAINDRPAVEEPKVKSNGHDQDQTSPPPPPPPKGSLIQTANQFITNFKPPDYLIDGILQRAFIYALTGPTGRGKTAVAMRLAAHVGTGRPILKAGVERGKVLYLAGENPDDICMRMIKLKHEMDLTDADMDNICFIPGTDLRLSVPVLRKRLIDEAKAHGPFAMVVVDTSAAFFEGEEENSNIQMLAHARMLRGLIKWISGKPCVLVLCHPVKNPDMENLAPRGGSGFLNEVDGNLVLLGDINGPYVELHYQIKLRGASFNPVTFALDREPSDFLRDSKGRPMSTVTAHPATSDERQHTDTTSLNHEDELMMHMAAHPRLTQRERAHMLGWLNRAGDPDDDLVQRMLKSLLLEGFVIKERGKHVLTKKGQKIVEDKVAGQTAQKTDAF